MGALNPCPSPLLRCQCNGHADTCNEQDGTGCPCQNNTGTGTCQGSSPSDRRDCYKYQVRLEKGVMDQRHHIPKGSELGGGSLAQARLAVQF